MLEWRIDEDEQPPGVGRPGLQQREAVVVHRPGMAAGSGQGLAQGGEVVRAQFGADVFVVAAQAVGDQQGRAGVDADGARAVGVEHRRLQRPERFRRRVVGHQTQHPGRRLARPAGHLAFQVVEAGARMGVQHQQGIGHGHQPVHHQGDGRVFDQVGEVAGVEGVAVVH